LQVIGRYKKFWGSNEWSIKIDFLYEQQPETPIFTNLIVEFKNEKSNLFNSFEVHDLCSCTKLMMKFAEGFGIAIFDRRLVAWMEDYFTEYGLKITSNIILNCLKKDLEEKIDVKIKKLTILDKKFTDILEYNPDDLLIDFEKFYGNEKWEPVDKTTLIEPIESKVNYKIEAKEFNDDYSTKDLVNNYNGLLEISNILFNDKVKIITDIVIEEKISPEFKPYTVLASLIAPDKTILGVFQPFSEKKADDGLIIIWKINELKINHQIKILYVLKQRIPFIARINENGEIKAYTRYVDVKSFEKTNFLVQIPALTETNIFSRKHVQSIEALFPIEFENQTILYLLPHYIVKIIDNGHFQKLIFSELFIDALFFDNVQLEGLISPVLTFYESLIPRIGAKLVKRIFRYHTYSNPIVIYNFDSSSDETIEIIEEYPSSTIINLISLGNQQLIEKPDEFNPDLKKLVFLMNATDNTIKLTLHGINLFYLEKSLNSVKLLGKEENFDVFQNINVESIIDSSNRNFRDFKKLHVVPNLKYDKLRLRSYSLKINEKIVQLEDQMENSELDSAFETLKQSDALELLKQKIKTNYESTFTENSPMNEIQEQPIVGNLINENKDELQEIDDFIENIDSVKKEENIIQDNFEMKVSKENELSELDNFINSYSDNSDKKKENFPVIDSPENKTISKFSEVVPETINEPTFVEKSSELSEELPEVVNHTTSIEKKPESKGDSSEFISVPTTSVKKSKTKSGKISKDKLSNKIKISDKIGKKLEISFTVVFEDYPETQEVHDSVLVDNEKVIVLDENQNKVNINEILVLPSNIYLKIPKDDRFLILLLNPRQDLASHIYGRWRSRSSLEYKLLLSKTEGTWLIKFQLLETAQLFDIQFKI
jgi:hypothetical protein